MSIRYVPTKLELALGSESTILPSIIDPGKNKKRSHDQPHLGVMSPVTFVILCPVATLFKKEEVQI